MAVRFVWDNEEKTILRYIFDVGWTWDEFFAIKKQANAVMDSIPHKFGVILHMPAENVIPADVLANTRNGLRGKHPNTVAIVVVSPRPIVRTMINTLSALSPLAHNGLETATTLDEARAFLMERLSGVSHDPVTTQNS